MYSKDVIYSMYICVYLYTIHTYVCVYVYECICKYVDMCVVHGLVLLVYIDLVVVSLEMMFVIRDATLHSVSLMEQIVDLKDDDCQPPSVVQCVYFPFVCMYCDYVYKVLCVFIHPIQCPHVIMCQVLLCCAPSLPAEWSLVDAKQGYTGGVEWEEE